MPPHTDANQKPAPISPEIGNPIAPGQGLTDPHIVIYGDHAYMYASHDYSPQNTGFLMKDWWIWSSPDLVHWTHVGTLKPEDTFIRKPFNDCWATFGICKNGKYYLYFSAGPTEIGVVVSDYPTGPWHDPLGKPLIPKGLTPTEQRDPDILIDDDGTAYMVYGTFDHFIVRLGDDLISLAEPPKLLSLDRKFGPYGEGKTDDKPSLHKRNGMYYLSWSSFYAMSTNVYGPYTYKGTVIEPDKVAPEFRQKDLWSDRHGNFFEWHNQWYYAYNDKSQPGRSDVFRDSCISYVHFLDNGEMAPIRIDRIGVGQYDAVQPRIEAEDYFAADGAEVRECPKGGFEVRHLHAGSTLTYPRVMSLPRNATLSLHLTSGNPLGGTIEVHQNDAQGPLLGSCTVPTTGAWNQYQTMACPLTITAGTHNLCFLFKGGPGELLRLDYFTFQ